MEKLKKRKLFEDGDQIMVSVTMFQKVVDTFKVKCRDRKYLVRDFKFDEQAIAKDNDQIKTLEQNKKDKFVIIFFLIILKVFYDLICVGFRVHLSDG